MKENTLDKNTQRVQWVMDTADAADCCLQTSAEKWLRWKLSLVWNEQGCAFKLMADILENSQMYVINSSD
jgi:hypothetical protein